MSTSEQNVTKSFNYENSPVSIRTTSSATTPTTDGSSLNLSENSQPHQKLVNFNSNNLRVRFHMITRHSQSAHQHIRTRIFATNNGVPINIEPINDSNKVCYIRSFNCTSNNGSNSNRASSMHSIHSNCSSSSAFSMTPSPISTNDGLCCCGSKISDHNPSNNDLVFVDSRGCFKELHKTTTLTTTTTSSSSASSSSEDTVRPNRATSQCINYEHRQVSTKVFQLHEDAKTNIKLAITLNPSMSIRNNRIDATTTPKHHDKNYHRSTQLLPDSVVPKNNETSLVSSSDRARSASFTSRIYNGSLNNDNRSILENNRPPPPTPTHPLSSLSAKPNDNSYHKLRYAMNVINDSIENGDDLKISRGTTDRSTMPKPNHFDDIDNSFVRYAMRARHPINYKKYRIAGSNSIEKSKSNCILNCIHRKVFILKIC
jgi:hypothetical protein